MSTTTALALRAGITAEINEQHRAVKQATTTGLAHALKAGELLMEVKTSMPHGGFESWVEASCEFSVRTAQAYMRVARELPKAQRVADLSFREAVALLAAPHTTTIEIEVWFYDPNVHHVPGFFGGPEEIAAAPCRADDERFIPSAGKMLMGDRQLEPEPIRVQRRWHKRWDKLVNGIVDPNPKFITKTWQRLLVAPSTVAGRYFVTEIVELGDAGAFSHGVAKPVCAGDVLATLRCLVCGYDLRWEWKQSDTQPWPLNFWLSEANGSQFMRVEMDTNDPCGLVAFNRMREDVERYEATCFT